MRFENDLAYEHSVQPHKQWCQVRKSTLEGLPPPGLVEPQTLSKLFPCIGLTEAASDSGFAQWSKIEDFTHHTPTMFLDPSFNF